MKLYSYFRSSCSWRVRIALAWKGLPYTYVPVNLLEGAHRSAEYARINPEGSVPTLELDDGRHLGQSMAILEYLEERHPEPPLLPRDPYLRAKARQLAEAVNSGIQPYQNMSVLRHVQQAMQGDEKAFAARWIARGLGWLEGDVAQVGGRFCVGDAPSFADVCLVPQLFGARRYNVDLAPFPRLRQIEASCMELPAFQAAVPERQPDYRKE